MTFTRRAGGRLVLGLVGALGALVAAPRASDADTHKDPEVGFTVNVPKDWRKIPIAGEEKYVVAKYIGDRTLYSKKENDGHTPEMKVIIFPAGRKKGADVTETDDGVVIRFNNPYKDYREYLKSNSYGGYYVSKEEETTVGGVPTTCLEVKFEKLTVPRRLIAWIFHADDADYAASFEILEDYWAKSSPEFVQCLKSFKITPRTKALGGTTGDEVVVEDLRKQTPEQRAKRRVEKFEKSLEKEIAALPAGWSVKRSKNYVALTHVDDKYTTRVLDQAEAVRTWLDKSWTWYGEGTPGSVMIRICKDSEEERAYNTTSGFASWFSGKAEITMSKDLSAGAQSFEFQWVNQSIMRFWLRDKNGDLTSVLPMWVRQGLDEFVMTAVLKGKALDFRPDEWELRLLREAESAGKLSKARDMITAGWEDFFKNTTNAKAQAGGLVRFLLDGPGKAGRSKEALFSYIKHLGAYVKEREDAEDKKDGEDSEATAPKTEEEEDEAFRKRENVWKERERELLDEVFKRTFGAWDDGAWKSFEQAYLRYVG